MHFRNKMAKSMLNSARKLIILYIICYMIYLFTMLHISFHPPLNVKAPDAFHRHKGQNMSNSNQRTDPSIYKRSFLFIYMAGT